MSGWTYRVVQSCGIYIICEVYDDGGHSGDSSPTGETLAELRADLERMMHALDKSVLVERGDKLKEVTDGPTG